MQFIGATLRPYSLFSLIRFNISRDEFYERFTHLKGQEQLESIQDACEPQEGPVPLAEAPVSEPAVPCVLPAPGL